MGKNKKNGNNACGVNGCGVNNTPAVDNDQLGENAYDKFAPEGKPDKKSKK